VNRDYIIRTEAVFGKPGVIRYFFTGVDYGQYLEMVLAVYPITELILDDSGMFTSVCRDGFMIGAFYNGDQITKEAGWLDV
jgi:hypothetical protein